MKIMSSTFTPQYKCICKISSQSGKKCRRSSRHNIFRVK